MPSTETSARSQHSSAAARSGGVCNRFAGLARVGTTGLASCDWAIQMIGDTDKGGRDWGTLVPEIRGYMADLVPGIRPSANDRIAVMRKGGKVRLKDYGAQGTSQITVGLAWDVTNGVNIDLDVRRWDSNSRSFDLHMHVCRLSPA